MFPGAMNYFFQYQLTCRLFAYNKRISPSKCSTSYVLKLLLSFDLWSKAQGFFIEDLTQQIKTSNREIYEAITSKCLPLLFDNDWIDYQNIMQLISQVDYISDAPLNGLLMFK